MTLDAWLPIAFNLPDGAKTRVALFEGTDWQVLETQGGGRALIVHDTLEQRWLDAGLIDAGMFGIFQFGGRQLRSISCSPSQMLCPVNEAKSPDNKSEALAFAQALKATRDIDSESALQDALYVEKITRLLPTYTISSRTGDDVVLGYWLTGGASIPATSFRRLRQTMSWIGAGHLRDIVQAAGFEVAEVIALDSKPAEPDKTEQMPVDQKVDTARRMAPEPNKDFELAGRPELAAFFNEHIVDIVVHRDRYKALGIEFPSAVILHGPPGCGKTFAVERLVDFLGWPSFQIDASSVASPYIHETSKKVAQVFEKAMENAPSVLVIDEMEAFLADREIGAGSSHHRVEEVAEFLRRIPEAVKNEVLIIAMTNRIDMIDPAIQRRGRFDHVIKVDFASEIEVQSLLDKLLSTLPKESDLDSKPLARELAGRPLSDVAFVVREGARLAARSGKERLDQFSLQSALNTAPAREREGGNIKRRIGFV
jgi:ATP-dependent 26S proteasome regulatory subunit